MKDRKKFNDLLFKSFLEGALISSCLLLGSSFLSSYKRTLEVKQDAKLETSLENFVSDIHVDVDELDISEEAKEAIIAINSYDTVDPYLEALQITPAIASLAYTSDLKKCSVICFKDITPGAGATTLIYIAKKQLEHNYDVVAVEVDKHDFMYFDEEKMYSISSGELGNTISKHSSSDIILLDGNTSPTADTFASEIIYLVEPSKIQLNKLLARDPKVFERNKNKKVVLNQCMLNSQDISDFEFETGLTVFATIPPLNDQSDENKALDEFFVKLGFYKQGSTDGEGSKKGIMGIFK